MQAAEKEGGFLDMEIVYRNVVRTVYSTLSGTEMRLPCLFSCAIDLKTHFSLFSSQNVSLYVALEVKNASTDTWIKVYSFSNNLLFGI